MLLLVLLIVLLVFISNLVKTGNAVNQFKHNDLTLISLNGDGKIAQRVMLHFDQIINGPEGNLKNDLHLDTQSPSPYLTQPKSEWVEKLAAADSIIISAHSQGVPVSIFLINKLIREGLINTLRQKIVINCMTGISHGPFPALKTSVIVKYVETEPARELFSFNDGDSSISTQYKTELLEILNAGVKILSVASWYDQVVPLYSASFHGISHPGLFRVIHIEGVDYNHDFISHLISFLLKLRNLGLSDRDLLVHLSDLIAGNLYFGTQGHSSVYEEEGVYDHSIRWLLADPLWKLSNVLDEKSSSSINSSISYIYNTITGLFYSKKQKGTEGEIDEEDSNSSSSISTKDTQSPKSTWASLYNYFFSTDQVINQGTTENFSAPTKLNPYYLPWLLSALLHDETILKRAELKSDIKELLNLYKNWNPTTESMKKLKYILEPIKSRL